MQMKKKIVSCFVVMLLALSCLFGLTACGGDELSGTTYDSWYASNGRAIKGSVTYTFNNGSVTITAPSPVTKKYIVSDGRVGIVYDEQTNYYKRVGNMLIPDKDDLGDSYLFMCKQGETPEGFDSIHHA